MGADISITSDQITPVDWLGRYVYVQYSVHEHIGLIVACGRSWLLFAEGNCIWAPAISKITTDIPQEVRPNTKRKQASSLPTDLSDLFK